MSDEELLAALENEIEQRNLCEQKSSYCTGLLEQAVIRLKAAPGNTIFNQWTLVRDFNCLLGELDGTYTGLMMHPETLDGSGYCISQKSKEKLKSLAELGNRYRKLTDAINALGKGI